MTLPELAALFKDIGFGGVLLFLLWRYMQQAGGDSRRNDDIIKTLVGNFVQALSAIQTKMDKDVEYRIEDRKVLTTISDNGGKQLETLIGMRDDLRGVAVLANKIDELKTLVERLKSSIELLVSAQAADAEDRDTIQATLERVESQIGVLIEESRESHREVMDAIRLLPPPNGTEPDSAPKAPNVTPLHADGAAHNATVDLPVTKSASEESVA